MQISTINTNNNIPFQKFIKIEGSYDKLDTFRTELKNKKNRKLFMNFITKEKEQSALYLISGKDFDKILKIENNNSFFTGIKLKIEKYLKKKPKTIKLKKAIKKLKNNNFSL